MTESKNTVSAVDTIQKLRTSISKVIKGRSDTIDLVLTGLFADGHVLLEDYPGSGKTTLAKTIGGLIDCSSSSSKDIVPFRRVQFTPDLLPSDVLGVNIFEPKTGTFRFQHGPIFSHIVLADEMNRTGPKVQAAFLECMAERQVTIDNKTYPLDDLFFVLGTQNPLDLAGTYPLPQVQLDRFLLKVPMKYVDRKSELDILKSANEIQDGVKHISPVVSREAILACREVVKSVHLKDEVLETIVDIIQDTRTNPAFQYGASTRAGIMFKNALQAYALINGRDYTTEDDIQTLAPYVLLHRVKIKTNSENTLKVFNEFIASHVETLIRKVA